MQVIKAKESFRSEPFGSHYVAAILYRFIKESCIGVHHRENLRIIKELFRFGELMIRMNRLR